MEDDIAVCVLRAVSVFFEHLLQLLFFHTAGVYRLFTPLANYPKTVAVKQTSVKQKTKKPRTSSRFLNRHGLLPAKELL